MTFEQASDAEEQAQASYRQMHVLLDLIGTEAFCEAVDYDNSLGTAGKPSLHCAGDATSCCSSSAYFASIIIT